jgi:TolA-binding protein
LKKNYEKFLFPFELYMKTNSKLNASTAQTTPASTPASVDPNAMLLQQQNAANRLALQQQQQLQQQQIQQQQQQLQQQQQQQQQHYQHQLQQQQLLQLQQQQHLQQQQIAMQYAKQMNQVKTPVQPIVNANLGGAATFIPPTPAPPTQPTSAETSSVPATPAMISEEKEPDTDKPGYTPMKRIPGMVFNPATKELEAETWAGFPVDMIEKVLGPLFDIVTTTAFPKEVVGKYKDVN